MPRRNAGRPVGSEDALAQRIAYERQRRNWTYDGLASRMAEVGCAMQPSAVYKIEKAAPRRRITVDELMAFSVVFEIPIDDLLLPAELAASQEVMELITAWSEAVQASAVATKHRRESWEAVASYAAAHPELQASFEEHLLALARLWEFPDDDESVRYWYSKMITDAASMPSFGEWQAQQRVLEEREWEGNV